MTAYPGRSLPARYQVGVLGMPFKRIDRFHRKGAFWPASYWRSSPFRWLVPRWPWAIGLLALWGARCVAGWLWERPSDEIGTDYGAVWTQAAALCLQIQIPEVSSLSFDKLRTGRTSSGQGPSDCALRTPAHRYAALD